MPYLRFVLIVLMSFVHAMKQASAFPSSAFLNIRRDLMRSLVTTSGGDKSAYNERCISRRNSNNLNPQACRAYQSTSVLRSSPLKSDGFESEASINSVRSFLSTVKHSIESEILPLVADQDKVVMLVGVSGGCDSVALLHALVQLAPPKLELHAIHFDHRQRGAESDGDREFVTDLCRELDVRLYTYYWDDDDFEAEPFSQESARAWRRSLMYERMQSLTHHQRGILATAHHKNDSSETLLLKMLRGVHITNLRGMEAVVETEDMPQAIWARPLLGLAKTEIQDFLTSQSLEWREDLSNASNKYKRNRVRNELIPLLTDIVGSESLLEKRLENISRQAQEVRADLIERAQEHLERNGGDTPFFLLPNSRGLTLVEREALYVWTKARMRGSILSYEQLQRVCAQLENYPKALQWTLQIGDGWNVIRNGAGLAVTRDSDPTLVADDSSHVLHAVDWSLVDESTDIEGNEALVIQMKEVPVSDAVAFRLSVSGQVSHSPFTPSWRNKPIKVKEFLRGQKVPLHLRNEAAVVLSSDGAVVSICVNGKWEVDASFCVSSCTGSRIELEVPVPNS